MIPFSGVAAADAAGFGLRAGSALGAAPCVWHALTAKIVAAANADFVRG